MQRLYQPFSVYLDSQDFFSLHCDETTQAQVKKQMDLRLRYWSSLHIMKFGADITNHSSLDMLKQKKFQKVVHYAVRTYYIHVFAIQPFT
jgi:hypothetical protein